MQAVGHGGFGRLGTPGRTGCIPVRRLVGRRGAEETPIPGSGPARKQDNFMDHSCATCMWLKMDESNWTKHNPPRLKPDAGGQCTWPAPAIILADSITKSYYYRPAGSSRSSMLAAHIGCPTWQAKPE